MAAVLSRKPVSALQTLSVAERERLAMEALWALAPGGSEVGSGDIARWVAEHRVDTPNWFGGSSFQHALANLADEGLVVRGFRPSNGGGLSYRLAESLPTQQQ